MALDQPAENRCSAEDVTSSLREELKAAVDRRLIADVPLGAFLSGGIDSSAVVAMMRELNPGNLLTCSIGFSEKRYDESRFARMVAEQKQTDHQAEVVEASDYGLLDRLVDLYDEPYADSSAIPTYRVCELARKHVTVALSGDGGDENFIGYRRYRLFAMEQRLRSLFPGWFSSIRVRLSWPLLPQAGTGRHGYFAAKRRSRRSPGKHRTLTCMVFLFFPDEGRSWLFSDRFKKDLQGYRSNEVFDRHLDGREFSDPLRMVQYLDFKTYLPGDILTKVDRASMAHSLEVRVPFLDHEFVNWTADLPTEMKLRGGSGKDVLKKALEPVLPNEVLYRSKMGFAVPLDIWFRGSLKERMMGALEDSALTECGIFNADSLHAIGRDHRSGRRDYSAILWALLMFDGFLRSQQA